MITQLVAFQTAIIFKNVMIAIDFRKQQPLDTDPKTTQKINFTEIQEVQIIE